MTYEMTDYSFGENSLEAIHNNMKQLKYIYVKVLLQVMYRKCSMRGWVEWQIQYEAKPMLHFTQDPNPSTAFFCTSHVNGVLSDLLFYIGRISSS